MAVAFLPYTHINAEDYSDTDAWNTKCDSSNIKTTEDYNACNAYREYIASTSPDLQAQLDDINSQKDAIAADISSYQSQLETYQKEVDDKNSSIASLETKRSDLQAQIESTQSDIETKQTEIEAKQETVQEMRDKLKQRIENGQKSIRINNMIDVLMGARTFSDFIRIASGLSSITAKEKTENEELVAAMDEIKAAQDALQKSKDELVSQQEDLKTQEEEIETQKEQLLISQYKVQVIEQAAHQQEAQLLAQSSSITSNLSAIQSQVSSLQSTLNAFQAQIEANKNKNSGNTSSDPASPTVDPGSNVPASYDGFVRPVTGGYRSAGTWDYPGGGIHFGYDFAVPAGTAVYSIGSGYILNSVNGCPYGQLGDWCGGPTGAMGGGNQIEEVLVVGDSLYAAIYCHMSNGTVISSGQMVSAGQQIGQSGSSGNSTGPHLHLEIVYLGDASNFTNYINSWNGDVTFGAGWNGYGRRCDAGDSAPCRLRPETIYGG